MRLPPFNVCFGLLAAVAGCCWNGLELEYVVSHSSGLGKSFGYGLTVLQCFGVAFGAAVQYLLVKLYYLYLWKTEKNKKQEMNSRKSVSRSSRSYNDEDDDDADELKHENKNNQKMMKTVLPHEFKRALPFFLVLL